MHLLLTCACIGCKLVQESQERQPALSLPCDQSHFYKPKVPETLGEELNIRLRRSLDFLQNLPILVVLQGVKHHTNNRLDSVLFFPIKLVHNSLDRSAGELAAIFGKFRQSAINFPLDPSVLRSKLLTERSLKLLFNQR